MGNKIVLKNRRALKSQIWRCLLLPHPVIPKFCPCPVSPSYLHVDCLCSGHLSRKNRGWCKLQNLLYFHTTNICFYVSLTFFLSVSMGKVSFLWIMPSRGCDSVMLVLGIRCPRCQSWLHHFLALCYHLSVPPTHLICQTLAKIVVYERMDTEHLPLSLVWNRNSSCSPCYDHRQLPCH